MRDVWAPRGRRVAAAPVTFRAAAITFRAALAAQPATFRAAVAALAALAALACLAGEATAQRSQLEQRILRDTLANGLEVIVVPNPGVPLVTIEAVVRNGAFTQPPEYEGLAHLYEHMIFGANSRWPLPGAFMGRLGELGADFNGTTSEERVNYYLTLSADSIEPGMRALAAALRTPIFRADEMDRERQVVIGEYDRNEADPFYNFQRAMGRALYGSAWSRKNALGERRVILAATPAMMREIQRRYYVPNNTALIVAGDVTPERALALARAVFGDWSRAPDPFAADPVPPVPPLERNSAIIVEQPIGNSIVVMRQWHGPSARGDVAATYAADVFSDVLNQPTSRFKQRLVDSGLFQSIHVNYYTLNHTGPITIMGETSPERLTEALAALDAELRLVAQPGYITAAELEPVKRQRTAGTMFSLERPSGFAHQVGFWWSVTGLEYFMGYVDAMARQTPAEVQSYAARYIVGKPSVTGVLVSPEVRRRLELTESAVMR
ncbi:MAG: insulinase family protein [Gemmatimonadaceae bacterium]|nr:insulinase family protein [Gemmatimonadaceae bacterium]